MENKYPNEVSEYPRLYTLHSQKGGVGKTSIALATAGLENILNDKKVVIIDADMTGASLIDIFPTEQDKDIKYFNDLLLAEPHDFASYTPICSKSGQTTQKEDKDVLQLFLRNVQIDELSVDYIPASPILKDILKVVPLISQEDHLHFFKHRLEDIITTLWKDFEVIIIDNPPGLYGISKSSLDMVIDEAIKRNPTRLDRIRFGHNSSLDNKSINMKSIFVSTPDIQDYKALLPSFSWFLMNNKCIKPDEIPNTLEKVFVVFNKSRSHKKGARFDSLLVLQDIFDKSKAFPDNRELNKDISNSLYDRSKRTGALASEYVSDFRMEEILKTIPRLKSSNNIRKGIEKWCEQVGKSLGIIK